MKIDVLGTEYTVEEKTAEQDKNMKDCDGYCDKTTKQIVVLCGFESNLHDPLWYQKKVLRHEIVHAFMFESGLHENAKIEEVQDEFLVDWIALQGPKIYKAWEQAKAI